MHNFDQDLRPKVAASHFIPTQNKEKYLHSKNRAPVVWWSVMWSYNNELQAQAQVELGRAPAVKQLSKFLNEFAHCGGGTTDGNSQKKNKNMNTL